MSDTPELLRHDAADFSRDGLSIEKMLELELMYAHQTAGEANSERTSLVSMYLTIFSAALYAYDHLNKAEPTHAAHENASVLLRLIFLGVWGIGFSFLFKLIRLRQALWGSLKAMNMIKEKYIETFPTFTNTFAWTAKSLPPAGKPWSITYNMAVLIVVLDSVALAAAVYTQALTNPDCGSSWPVYWGVLAFILSCTVQERFYAYHMSSPNDDTFSLFHDSHKTLRNFLYFFCFARHCDCANGLVRGGTAETSVLPVQAAVAVDSVGSTFKQPRAQSVKKRK